VATFSERFGDASYLGAVELASLRVGEDARGVSELRDVELEEVTLRECDLASATLRRVVLRDCDVVDCDLSLMNLIDCRFVECRFTRCRAVGVAWTGAEGSLIAKVPFSFEACRLDLGSFQGVDVAGSVFRDCSLREVDFTEAVLRGADFAGSDLAGATFVRSDLREADLTGALNVALDPRQNRLAGATFSVEGALGLLEAFEIVVR
jgi:fluoroquinolone resistance protein